MINRGPTQSHSNVASAPQTVRPRPISRPLTKPRLRQFPPLNMGLVEHLLSTMPIGFAYADRYRHITRWNELFCAYFGVEYTAEVSSNLGAVIPASIWAKFDNAYRRALTGQVLADVDLGTDVSGERHIHHTLSFYPVSDSDKIVGVGVALTSDSSFCDPVSTFAFEADAFPPSSRRSFLADMMSALTQGKLVLCAGEDDLPKRLNPVCPPVPLSPDILSSVRKQVRDSATFLKFDDIRSSDLVLGVGEALDNVLVHAGEGNAEVSIDKSRSVVQVRVNDHGNGIAEDIIHRCALERGYTTAGTLGHGFFLILNTCDRVWLMTSPVGTTVVLEQDRIAKPI